MNLLSNAFKFVPAGGDRALPAADRDDRARACRVDDSGPGVKPELRRRSSSASARATAARTARLGDRARARDRQGIRRDAQGRGSSARFGPGRRALPGVAADASLSASDAGARVRQPKHALDRSMLDGLIEELRLPALVRAAARTSATPRRDAPRGPTVLVVEDNADMNRFVAQCLSRELPRDLRVRRAAGSREGARASART